MVLGNFSNIYNMEWIAHEKYDGRLLTRTSVDEKSRTYNYSYSSTSNAINKVGRDERLLTARGFDGRDVLDGDLFYDDRRVQVRYALDWTAVSYNQKLIITKRIKKDDGWHEDAVTTYAFADDPYQKLLLYCLIHNGIVPDTSELHRGIDSLDDVFLIDSEELDKDTGKNTAVYRYIGGYKE